MRIIYLGTPEFAVPTLEKLLAWPKAEVVGLVCQPDRPAGRGKHIFAPPTKLVAQAHNIPVFQPEKLSKSAEIVAAMRDLKPDVLVMVAFGQILKRDVLELAPWKVVNLHGSLLPKYRGAAPINWAIINGETVTGITTMLSDQGVDTGDMLLQRQIPLGPDTYAEELSRTMSIVGAELVIETLDQLRQGKLAPVAQDDSQATYAPRLTKEMGAIDWFADARQIHNLVRGLSPWPGTFTYFRGTCLKVIATAPKTATAGVCGLAQKPGSVIATNPVVEVACGKDGSQSIELLEVQVPGKAKVAARNWANGIRLQAQEVLGSP